MYALAGLTIELVGPREGSALWSRLAPFQRPGRGELVLRLRERDEQAAGERLRVEPCGDGHACAGDGLDGRIGEREAELRAAGGDAALVAALRLACALWLLPRGGLLLHGACVERGGAGHVFAGESGAGKTTLAARLADERCEVRARVISDEVSCVAGDRLFGQPFQSKLGDGRAPDAGLPLSAICALSQAPEPRRVRLTRAQAASALLPRVFLPARDRRSVQRALAAIDRLVGAVPLFSLALPDDARAVAAALPDAGDAGPAPRDALSAARGAALAGAAA